MKIVNALGKYLWHLLIAWIISSFFFVLDIVGGIEKLFPYFQVQWWFYPVVFGACYVIANIYLFVRQELAKKLLEEMIAELQAIEADIRLKIKDEPRLGVAEFSIDERGVPRQGTIEVPLEYENIGYKPGELIWHLDRTETQLSPPFELDPNNDGDFNISIETIDGQDKGVRYLIIPIKVREQEPVQFIHALNSLALYSIVVSYYTRRIGGDSTRQKLIIRGNFQEVRRKTRCYLEKLGYVNLAKLVSI